MDLPADELAGATAGLPPASANDRRLAPADPSRVKTRRRWSPPGLHDRWPTTHPRTTLANHPALTNVGPHTPLSGLAPTRPSQTLANHAPSNNVGQPRAPLQRWPTSAPRSRWCQPCSMGRTCFVWGDGARSVVRGQGHAFRPLLCGPATGSVGAPHKTSSPHRAKLKTRAPTQCRRRAVHPPAMPKASRPPVPSEAETRTPGTPLPARTGSQVGNHLGSRDHALECRYPLNHRCGAEPLPVIPSAFPTRHQVTVSDGADDGGSQAEFPVSQRIPQSLVPPTPS
ncbi:hypothetical protein SAMN04487818_108268 [Actinokineospora terrae]|uniref:Uncharacterized protein n=1 Tax=Actinokineospora terrae TaxID=155974 RepID=A0A1H9VCP5_9PSEU|nr:hypothetical protein SAMN04487818_108268 [Actinokineospora terrae]